MQAALNRTVRASVHIKSIRVFATESGVTPNESRAATLAPLDTTESKINSIPSMREKNIPPRPNPATTPSGFLTDVEIGVSKIFPAGFGWQLFSSIAEHQGLDSSSVGFYALTGIGDAIGVGAGHILYQILKRPAIKFANTHAGTDWKEPDFNKERKIAAWLSCAAFASGGLWQPTVNVLSMVSNSALLMAPITGIVCGSVFLGGLRAGRRAFDLQPDYQNAKDDAVLSCKVGGGTGLFITTMTGLQHNAFEGLLGITENMPLLESCMHAGSSTFLGFLAVAGLTNTAKGAYQFTQPPITSVATTKKGEAEDDVKTRDVKTRTVIPK